MISRPWQNAYGPGIPFEIDLPADATLQGLLSDAFARHADLVAITCLAEKYSFAKVKELSGALASFLQERGLCQGERVAIITPNCPAFIVAAAAALRSGLVVVPVNPLYTAREMQQQLRDADVSAVVAGDTQLPTVEQAVSGMQLKVLIRTKVKGAFEEATADAGPITIAAAVAQGRDRPLQPVTVSTNDLAFLQYTGGTTGVSKGAMLTHRSVYASLMQIAAWMPAELREPGTSLITPLPLYHIYPLASALSAIWRGANNRLVPDPRDPQQLFGELLAGPFETILGINTLFNALVAAPMLKQVDFSKTRTVSGAGASTQEAVAQRWEAAGGPPITEAYGLTETSPSACFNFPGTNGALGRPVPSTDARVVDAEDRDVPLGEPGELLLKGPQLFAGYWHREEETRRAFTADGWFRTGDIVTMDETGLLRMVDRKKDMILVSGFNVYPNEIEAVVAKMDQVGECACIGVPDDRRGEVPHLFVVARDPQLTPDQIEAHCRVNLAAYKIPRHITLMKELPKSPVGKILRRSLRDLTKAEAQ
ncbi:AMP-binding protein [Variovorax paradoxus]|nr:AMP-binding protein [Variovorax paradoxus]